MKRLRTSVILLIVIMLLSGEIPANTIAEKAFSVPAKSAILLENSTNKVLFSQNADVMLPMASTTKIMTALVVLENCADINEIIETHSKAYGVEGSSIYLHKNEKISIKDLLYGLMLSSGNDAAVALAMHFGGSLEGFAEMMNAKAKSIGANSTNFVTPHGLHHDDHYTTAYDLALIASAALKNAAFSEIVSTTYYRTTTGAVTRTFKSKNRILWEYEGGSGIKTGYTVPAGKCLVFSAQKDGMTLVGVVLNCSTMFPTAMEILNYGYSNYEMVTAAKKDTVICRTFIKKGKKNILALKLSEDIIVVVKKDGSATFKSNIVIPDNITAPVEAGTEYGRVEIFEDGTLVASPSLYAAQSISSVEYADYYGNLVKNW